MRFPPRWLAPEVVQTSAMDCGPAALKCLLEGHHIPVSYGRLREACQTDVDGTSIDVLEEVAVQLGLEAEQIIIPADHLLLAVARALPALLVVQLANGVTHFVVAWRRHGALVQVMDPATGRRWTPARHLLNELYLHTLRVPPEDWHTWAQSDDFLDPLRWRLAHIGVERETRADLVAQALAAPSWQALARLDAATRLVTAVVHAGGLRRGREATRALVQLAPVPAALAPAHAPELIPPAYWSVRPAPAEPGEPELLQVRGAVLVRVRGRRAPTVAPAAEDTDAAPAPLPPELAAALAEPPSNPARDLLQMLRADGLLVPTVLLGALLLAAAGVVVEALLLNGLLNLGSFLGMPVQRAGALAVLLLFLAALLLLESTALLGLLRVGRRLEARLRIAFLTKLPRLGDRYFQSRLTSDMAERSHVVHLLRLLPTLGGQLLRTGCALVLTAAGMIWLNPVSAPLALLAAALAIGIPLASQSALGERDLRVRTYVGALSRFVLDALLGLVVIRTHSAERAVRREHERLLIEWVRSSRDLFRTVVLIEGLQLLVGSALAVALLLLYLRTTTDIGAGLLLVYWALTLPLLGEQLALLARKYPNYRNVTLRLLEPLGALEEEEVPAPAPEPAGATPAPGTAPPAGVAVTFHGVSVRAAGHTILQELDLTLEPGSHVAVVGSSGAGKSSFVGLLLGWHRPATGQVLVDGRPLTGAVLTQLRAVTAWVDPAVQLWNRPLLDNLCYGLPADQVPPLSPVLAAADLQHLLETLPDGLQTPLGEGGGLLSGGEGQRVRLGRALLRPDVRLVILDEPFRGLDRERRRQLLARARAHWGHATLICVTHDIGETLDFGRVLVIEQGCIVEDAAPACLAADPTSRYRVLLEAEQQVRDGLWQNPIWRRMQIAGGRVAVAPRAEELASGRPTQPLEADMADDQPGYRP